MTLQEKRTWLMNESGNYMAACAPPTMNQICYLIHDIIKSENDIYIFCDSRTRVSLFKAFLLAEQYFLGSKIKIKVINDLLTLKNNLTCVAWVSPEDDILKSVGMFEYCA